MKVFCDMMMHTMYRSRPGQVNGLQSRTQYQSTYSFSRCASAAAGPTIGDVRALNRLVRKIRGEVIMLRFWQQKGKSRIVGYPDAAYQNIRPDFSTQRGHCIFIAEERRDGVISPKGSLVDYESTKIKKSVQSTTVAELYFR